MKTKGENGEKEVYRRSLLINGKVVSEKVIGEKIIKKPIKEVVLRGISISKNLTAMYTPSRGRISSNFGVRWGRMHEGIDIAADSGTPIYAALDGKINFSGWQEGYGYVIKITHSNDVETVYAHCSKLVGKVKDTVKKGQLIAYVGSTGNSTGPHLHFEVRINGKPQNPMPYVYNN